MLGRPSTLISFLDVIWFYFFLAFKVGADYFQALKISFTNFASRTEDTEKGQIVHHVYFFVYFFKGMRRPNYLVFL